MQAAVTTYHQQIYLSEPKLAGPDIQDINLLLESKDVYLTNKGNPLSNTPHKSVQVKIPLATPGVSKVWLTDNISPPMHIGMLWALKMKEYKERERKRIFILFSLGNYFQNYVKKYKFQLETA